MIRYGVYRAPLGVLLGYVWSERGLVDMGFYEDFEEFKAYLRRCFPGAEEAELRDLRALLDRYFGGERVALDYPLDVKGTPFQLRVWKTVKRIPYGKTRSYGWIARRVGKPRAARGVGQAMASNPVVLIIPCHRVIRGDGTIGGYGGKVWLKRKLLELEGVLVKG